MKALPEQHYSFVVNNCSYVLLHELDWTDQSQLIPLRPVCLITGVTYQIETACNRDPKHSPQLQRTTVDSDQNTNRFINTPLILANELE